MPSTSLYMPETRFTSDMLQASGKNFAVFEGLAGPEGWVRETAARDPVGRIARMFYREHIPADARSFARPTSSA